MMKRLISIFDLYTRLAPFYDNMAKISPSFPSARLVYEELSPHLPSDNQAIADIGIGTGLSSLPFAQDGHFMTGIDGSQEMLAVCEKKGIARRLIRVDFEKAALPLETGEFDASISANTFYTLSHAAQEHVLDEMHRITRPGGLIAFNYEVGHPEGPDMRLNDATFDLTNPCTVATYSMTPEEIRERLAAGASEIVSAKTQTVATKWDGFPIVFETLVCRRF